MIYIQSGLYVSVRQLENGAAPLPLPLENGFSENNAYLVWARFRCPNPAKRISFSRTTETKFGLSQIAICELIK